MTNHLLELRSIGTQVNNKALIRNISFTLPRGGIHVILGANGAGKSTLLRCIHGLTPVHEGQITPQPGSLRQSMVFQKPVFLRTSVEKNLKIATTDPLDPSSINRHLQQVGLAHKGKQAAQTLSGGEQQKLALARALLGKPELLLLDEPTANLDVHAAPEFESLLMQVAADGCTLLMTSHSLRQAKRLADTIIFMHEGEVLEHSPALSFFDQPTSLRAQRFLLLAD